MTPPLDACSTREKYCYNEKNGHRTRLNIVVHRMNALVTERSQRILSIGCGPADIAEPLFTGEVTGFDQYTFHNERIPIVRGKIKRIFEADPTRIFPEAFDAVFVGEFLEHMPHIFDVMMDIRTLLKQHGVLIATVPNIRRVQDRVNQLCGKMSKHIRGYLTDDRGDKYLEHVRFFGAQDLRDFLELCGFEAMDITSSSMKLRFGGEEKIDLETLRDLLKVPAILERMFASESVRPEGTELMLAFLRALEKGLQGTGKEYEVTALTQAFDENKVRYCIEEKEGSNGCQVFNFPELAEAFPGLGNNLIATAIRNDRTEADVFNGLPPLVSSRILAHREQQNVAPEHFRRSRAKR